MKSTRPLHSMVHPIRPGTGQLVIGALSTASRCTRCQNMSTQSKGEIVMIRLGGRISVDGQVVSGHSFVEQAAITGEPMPSEKKAGSQVYAGTINQGRHAAGPDGASRQGNELREDH